jgi:hypothetical protein
MTPASMRIKGGDVEYSKLLAIANDGGVSSR